MFKRDWAEDKRKGHRCMLKGVNKQIIEINNTGNDYFERVLFFVRPEYCSLPQRKLETGAQDYMAQLRELGGYTGGYLRKREKRKRMRFWTFGACIIGVCAALIGLIFLL